MTYACAMYLLCVANLSLCVVTVCAVYVRVSGVRVSVCVCVCLCVYVCDMCVAHRARPATHTSSSLVLVAGGVAVESSPT